MITPIDFDHEAYLGHTIEAIAGEKAGILKPGVPAVFARQRPEARPCWRLGRRSWACGWYGPKSSRFVIWRSTREDRSIQRDSDGVRSPGEHQVDNAITAVLALRELGVPPEGIADARWPGRLEYVSPNPDVILDGAHNPAGARALRALSGAVLLQVRRYG